ncbi:MAG: metal-sulfur cluster assembly factor [Actinomycetota bacterium]
MPAQSEPRSDATGRGAAWAAINEVIDPCSRFNGSHLGLVDLGMVKDVDVHGSSATITLLLDDPVCMYTFIIQKEIREALAKRGIDHVEIRVCGDEIWTTDRLSHVAAVRLGRVAAPRRAPPDGGNGTVGRGARPAHGSPADPTDVGAHIGTVR